jgi:hypothetical protein
MIAPMAMANTAKATSTSSSVNPVGRRFIA